MYHSYSNSTLKTTPFRQDNCELSCLRRCRHPLENVISHKTPYWVKFSAKWVFNRVKVAKCVKKSVNVCHQRNTHCGYRWVKWNEIKNLKIWPNGQNSKSEGIFWDCLVLSLNLCVWEQPLVSGCASRKKHEIFAVYKHQERIPSVAPRLPCVFVWLNSTAKAKKFSRSIGMGEIQSRFSPIWRKRPESEDICGGTETRKTLVVSVVRLVLLWRL